jgi:hypothetical protein
MADIAALHRFLRAEFETEAGAGFPRVSRVPDMRVKHFLDYYASLGSSARGALADAVTLRGALGLTETAADEYWADLKRRPAWNDWQHEAVTGVARDPHFYAPVTRLRMCVAQAHAERSLGRPQSLPPEMVEYAGSIRSPKAPELRKRTRAALTALYGAGLTSVTNKSGSYDGTLNGRRVQVGLTFGSQYMQLGYTVAVEAAQPSVMLRGCLESSLGMGAGHWDFIVDDNVDDAMALLGECVEYVVELPRRLPQGCLGGEAQP